MTLLRDIQATAVDEGSSLATVLRRAKILAARLAYQPLEEWVEKELNGYKCRAQELPSYRIVHTGTYGHFNDGYRQPRNYPVPPSALPEELRAYAQQAYFAMGVAALEELSRRSEESLKLAWGADLVRYVSNKIMRGWDCMDLWKVVSRSDVVGVVDAIRNRVLTFALEVEKLNQDAGEAPMGKPPIPVSKVGNVFNMYILGGTNNVAAGSEGFVQVVDLPASSSPAELGHS
ncbi:MAG: hypothetical protein KGR26_01740 [Cyanobacteria bacterium REEB65]|nr:hypothetical protein [Cyanobacteria bacterium REEB65]